MADPTAPVAEHVDSPERQPRLSADAKWIVTTGVALGILLVTLTSTALLVINARIDDTNAQMGQLQIDMREMRTELRTEMQELRTELRTEMHSMRADLQAEIRGRHAETQTDIRELRGMLLQLLERTAPANPVD